MRYFIKLLSLPTPFSSASFMLVLDSKCYLFNVGDGLQRLAAEHKIKLSRVSDLFLTSTHADSLSALPGIMLTLADSTETKQRKLHGPPGISAYFAAASTFAHYKHYKVCEYSSYNLEIDPYKVTSKGKFQDENITVKAIPVCSFQKTSVEVKPGVCFDAPKESGMCYIVECPQEQRKFRVDKAKELGVTPGPMFGKLSSGQSVEVNGVLVHPEDVLDPPIPPPVFSAIHFPSTDLINEQVFRQVLNYTSPEWSLSTIIHLSPNEVLQTESYKKFLAELPPSVQNIVLNETASSQDREFPIFMHSDILVSKLKEAAPSIFSLPQSPELTKAHPSVPNCIRPKFLMNIHLSPFRNKGVEYLQARAPSTKLHRLQVRDTPPAAEHHQESYWDKVTSHIPNSNPSVLLLGTGSMKPGKYRNVSGIFLGSTSSGILMDCGEGTYAQLVRHFGSSVQEVLLNLKSVLVTHLHADHHLGIIKLLHERAKITSESIKVIGPSDFYTYLSVCNLLAGPLHFSFEQCKPRHLLFDLVVESVPVDHRIEAYGFVVTHESGWKVVYSGDTRPCNALVEAGRDATLLIHEATFEDELKQEAIHRFHTTIGEAIEVAQKMNAWKLMLTHFSQRYAKFPETGEVDYVLGFDLMCFRMSEVHTAVQAMNALTNIFESTD